MVKLNLFKFLLGYLKQTFDYSDENMTSVAKGFSLVYLYINEIQTDKKSWVVNVVFWWHYQIFIIDKSC